MMATPLSTWLSDQAVNLQLQELDTNVGFLKSCPDPERARRWLVLLCFVRADDGLRMALADDLRAFAPDHR